MRGDGIHRSQPVEQSCPPAQQCPTDVAARQPSEYRLALTVEPGTLSGEPDCADRQVDPPIRSHTLATSCRPLLAQLAAVVRKSSPAADRL